MQKYEDLLEEINSHIEKCRVHCDDYHSHDALRGCVAGPKDSLLICKMNELINKLRFKLNSITEIIEKL